MKGLHAEILDFLDFKIPKDWAMILCKASNTKCPTFHLTCMCHVFLSWWWQNLVQVTIFVLLPIGCWMTPRRKPKQDVISQCTTITPSHPCPLKNHSGSRPKPMSSVLAALTAISPNQIFQLSLHFFSSLSKASTKSVYVWSSSLIRLKAFLSLVLTSYPGTWLSSSYGSIPVRFYHIVLKTEGFPAGQW